MPPVGIAVVGAGRWGSTLSRALADTAAAELRWICDLDRERRERAREAHPQARVTAALEEALADPGVAAVVVAVDPASHHDVGLRVLHADRHLLIEKPMSLSVADAAELLDAADRRRRVLTVGHLLLHHPAVRRARALAAEGSLGDLVRFESTRSVTGATRAAGPVWWTLAPHDVSLALHLFDAAPTRVSAVAGGHPAGAEDTASVTLTFADGRAARIDVAQFSAAKVRRFSLIGARRMVTFDELDRAHGLRLRDVDDPDVETVVSVEEADALRAQCEHFVACVARGYVGGGNAAHALEVIRVLEAGSRSMRSGGDAIQVSSETASEAA